MANPAEQKADVQVIAAPAIEKRILVVRGRQVMLDEDLAEEFSHLKSQFVMSSGGHGGRRKRSLVFAE